MRIMIPQTVTNRTSRSRPGDDGQRLDCQPRRNDCGAQVKPPTSRGRAREVNEHHTVIAFDERSRRRPSKSHEDRPLACGIVSRFDSSLNPFGGDQMLANYRRL